VKIKSLEEAEVKKFALLAPLLVGLVLMSQPVFAEPTPTVTFHVEGKAAVAWDPCYRVAYVVVEGMINLPDCGPPMKGTFLVIICGCHVKCFELCKNDFKWSMDHASLCLSWLSIEWCTVPPTKTGHININDCIHLVVNEQARCGSATAVWKCGCQKELHGLVLHGTGMLALSLIED
jgi:hypothetical protein